ncbi:MAG: hypothetical protein ACI4IT_06635 [Oscillospiraceae bacterium]
MKKVIILILFLFIFSSCSYNFQSNSNGSADFSDKNWSLSVTADNKLFSPIPESEEEELVWSIFSPFWDFEGKFSESEVLQSSDISRWIETTFLLAEKEGLLENYICETDNGPFYVVPFETFQKLFTDIFPYIEFESAAEFSGYYCADNHSICRPMESVPYFQFSAVGGTFISDVREIGNNRILIEGCAVFPDSLSGNSEITKQYIYENCDYSKADLVVELLENGWKYISYDYQIIRNRSAE